MRPPGREALERLECGGFAIVLLDHQLPDTTGLEILDAIRARPGPRRSSMITAPTATSRSPPTRSAAGADDYLAKDDSLAELLPQVLERVRRVRELRKALAAASGICSAPNACRRSAR